jgi:hypothetical protein
MMIIPTASFVKGRYIGDNDNVIWCSGDDQMASDEEYHVKQNRTDNVCRR